MGFATCDLHLVAMTERGWRTGRRFPPYNEIVVATSWVPLMAYQRSARRHESPAEAKQSAELYIWVLGYNIVLMPSSTCTGL